MARRFLQVPIHQLKRVLGRPLMAREDDLTPHRFGIIMVSVKPMTVRFSDEVAELLDRREGELREMSVNTLVNVAVRRMLAPDRNKATEASDEAVASALKRVMQRDAGILEALKHI